MPGGTSARVDHRTAPGPLPAEASAEPGQGLLTRAWLADVRGRFEPVLTRLAVAAGHLLTISPGGGRITLRVGRYIVTVYTTPGSDADPKVMAKRVAADLARLSSASGRLRGVTPGAPTR